MLNRKKSVSRSLLGGLAASIIMLVIFCIAVVFGMIEHRESIERMYQVHLTSTVQLATANDHLWRLRYGFPQYLVLDATEREKIIQEEPVLDHEIRKILAEYEALPLSEGERKQLDIVETAYNRYMAARPKWFALVKAGNLTEAAEYRAQTTTPFGKETVENFNALMKMQQEFARSENQRMLSQTGIGPKSTIGLLLVLLLLMVPLTWVIWNTVRTLRLAQEIAHNAVVDIFKEPIVIEGRDELDTLISTMRLMTERFISHTNELETTRNKLTQQHEIMERQVEERTTELQKALVITEKQADEVNLLSELNDRLQNCQSLIEAKQVIESFSPKLFSGIPGQLALINASRNMVDTFAEWGGLANNNIVFTPEACWGLRRHRPHYSGKDIHDVTCTHTGNLKTLCIPLQNQDGAIGVLTLDVEHIHMASHDLDTLAVRFANQISLALTNLRLREKLREQSIIDALTSLFNRRFYEETLARELARAARLSSSIALLVLDVDHFKNFNDTHGHEAGDRILALVGQSIKTNIRPSDIGCRYGGEEFVIVMPDTEREVALKRANKLREYISQQATDYYKGQFGTVTVSCGVAIYPEHGSDSSDLFIKADKALYQAKKNGRNRVEVLTD